MNITANELAVLNALNTNEFGDQPGDWVWSNCINCAGKPSGLEGNALSGTGSSLCSNGQKGRDACIRLTPAGIAAVKAA